MIRKITICFLFFILYESSVYAQTHLTGFESKEPLDKMAGTISCQVWQYDGNKVSEKHAIALSKRGKKYTGSLNVGNSQWKCALVEGNIAKEGGVDMKVTFRVKRQFTQFWSSSCF